MKLLVVISAMESSWGSCKVISPNLHKLYMELGEPFLVEWVELPDDMVKGERHQKCSSILNLRRAIEGFKPDRLVFVDHLPPPPRVIALLSMQLNVKKLPPIIFHIYGDFTYFSRDWVVINELLPNHPITFITASHAQQRLLGYFLDKRDRSIDGNVEKLCFPLNSSEYYFDSGERESFRNQMGLTKDDLVILYSGRVSLQKNVDILLSEFLQHKDPEKKLHLWIVGAFDDVGVGFLGVPSYPGYMFSKMQEILGQADKEKVARVKFFGFQNKAELKKINSASDLFVSLSLYHDEDYGMSPAEALATGLRSILTDWGGYSSFANSTSWECKLLSVDINEFGLSLATKEFHQYLFMMRENPDNDYARQKRSEAFMSEFSIQGNIEPLKQILMKKPASFVGFNWGLQFFGNEEGKGYTPNNFLLPRKDSFYFDCYRNYISKLNGNIENER